MIANGKAQASTGLVMAFGGITILILTIVFLVMVQDSGAKKHVNDVVNKVDNDITLLNYLRTPADPEHNIADLIAEYSMTKDAKLKEDIVFRSRQIFEDMFEGDYTMSIKIDGEEIMKMKKTCSWEGTVAQDIMLFDGKKARVELICG
jgi:hypothetical protein